MSFPSPPLLTNTNRENKKKRNIRSSVSRFVDADLTTTGQLASFHMATAAMAHSRSRVLDFHFHPQSWYMQPFSFINPTKSEETDTQKNKHISTSRRPQRNERLKTTNPSSASLKARVIRIYSLSASLLLLGRKILAVHLIKSILLLFYGH